MGESNLLSDSGLLLAESDNLSEGESALYIIFCMEENLDIWQHLISIARHNFGH